MDELKCLDYNALRKSEKIIDSERTRTSALAKKWSK